jgi:hypothetical protein
MPSPERAGSARVVTRLVETLRPAAAGAVAADVRIGLGYTGVCLADGRCGVAHTFRDLARGACAVFPGLRPLAGRPAAEILALLSSEDARTVSAWSAASAR